jgi:RNA polymerase sigma-70 factor (ECF subfamily)
VISSREPNNLPISDLELVRKAGLGDDTAFHELVDRYANDLFRLAYALVGNADDAEDILQETFLGAFEHLRSFKGRSSVKTWLIRILVKQVAKYHRYWRLRETKSLDEISESVKTVLPARDQELRMDIKTMISTLSPEHREIIVLRELQGYSYKEIAEILGIPPGTVESRLFRARQDLKDRFKDYLL